MLPVLGGDKLLDMEQGRDDGSTARTVCRSWAPASRL
jgi:hypothetical protein